MVCESPCIFDRFLRFFLLISMHLHIQPFKAGLCHGIHDPVSPYCRGGVFLIERATQNNLYNPPLLSELSESQESGNHQDKTSISVSDYTRLDRPAFQ